MPPTLAAPIPAEPRLSLTPTAVAASPAIAASATPAATAIEPVASVGHPTRAQRAHAAQAFIEAAPTLAAGFAALICITGATTLALFLIFSF